MIWRILTKCYWAKTADTEEIIEHQSASEEDGVQRRASGLVAVGTCVLVAHGARAAAEK